MKQINSSLEDIIRASERLRFERGFACGYLSVNPAPNLAGEIQRHLAGLNPAPGADFIAGVEAGVGAARSGVTP